MSRPQFISLQVKGAYCLEAFCRHHGIHHPAVEQLTAHLLSIAHQADNLPAWEEAGQRLPLNGRGDPWPADVDEAVPARLRADFRKLVHDTVEIGLVDFHGASTYRPLEHYEACKRLLKKHGVPAPPQLTELQPRPFPFHLWRPALKLLLGSMPLLIIGYYGQRYLTAGRLPSGSPAAFLASVWLVMGLILSLTFFMDWLLMRRFTWVLEPEGVHIQEHGATVQVVPWSEITGLKLKPVGLVMWAGKKCLRFSYLPQAKAERLLEEMEARIREPENGG